mmetsp:Transcript_3763/g.8320  ORF Transcript_3763/g.8320 Transcript_3763/m.8320 type:complete len:148 (+) Transcript_3763:193-636(+)
MQKLEACPTSQSYEIEFFCAILHQKIVAKYLSMRQDSTQSDSQLIPDPFLYQVSLTSHLFHPASSPVESKYLIAVFILQINLKHILRSRCCMYDQFHVAFVQCINESNPSPDKIYLIKLQFRNILDEYCVESLSNGEVVRGTLRCTT